MQKLKKRGGFTLVELIVVLVILAILAALLIPALTGYIDKSKKVQFLAESRMLNVAIQTVASEAYGSAEWPSNGAIFTIANQKGKNVTKHEDTATYDNLQTRYNEIVKLAEVPSLSGGTGDFAAFTDTKGSVFCVLYNSGRGLLGAYFRETGEYKVYDEQKNINNYTTWYGNYINSVISTVIDSSAESPWSQQMIDYHLTR